MKTVYLVKAWTEYSSDYSESHDIMIFIREEDAKRFIETKQEYFKDDYLEVLEIPLFSENDNINDLKDSDYLSEDMLK